MISFFRRVRQNLLSTNKSGKYLKYAIGEIALVMIGILLALQVNNWNELRKEQQLQKRYLSELLLDLQTDSIAISGFLKDSDTQWKYKQNLITFFNNEIDYAKDSIDLFFNTQWQATYSFNPITTTLDEMKSTGNIKVIKNPDVRRQILETYNNYHVFINGHQAIYNQQQEETWKLFFATIPDLYTGSSEQLNNADVKAALERFEVRNRIFGNYVKGLNSALIQLQTWNTELITAIKSEMRRLGYD